MSDVRSGSTLLENILTNIPKSISVGEFRLLDSYIYHGKIGKRSNWSCSCGESFNKCNYWVNIFEKLKKNKINIIKTSLNKPKNSDNKNLNFNISIIKNNDRIYDAIFNYSDANILIDSSKKIDYGKFLYNYSNFEVKIIYLKRKYRAVSLSKLKWIKKYGKKEQSLFKLLLKSKLYDMRLKKFLKKIDQNDFLEVKYEKFLSDPDYLTNLISKKFNFQNFIMPSFMDLRDKHTIGGTPNRFNKRPIKYDKQWELIAQRKPIFNFIGKFLELI